MAHEDLVTIVAKEIATTKDFSGNLMIGRATLKRAKAVIAAIEADFWILRKPEPDHQPT